MNETLKILFKLALVLIGGGSTLITFYLVLFTAVMVLAPTSSANQVEEWKKTVVKPFGTQMNQLSLQRLKLAALGIGLILPFAGIAGLSLWLFTKQ